MRAPTTVDREPGGSVDLGDFPGLEGLLDEGDTAITPFLDSEDEEIADAVHEALAIAGVPLDEDEPDFDLL